MASTVPHAHSAVWATVGVVRDAPVRPPRARGEPATRPPRAHPAYFMYFSTLRLCSSIERGLSRPLCAGKPAHSPLRASRRAVPRPQLSSLHVLLDVALVLVEAAGERMVAGVLGDEVEVLAPVGGHHGLDRALAGVADRARRQPLVLVGVVRVVLVVELGAVQAVALVPLLAGGRAVGRDPAAVADRRVWLQPPGLGARPGLPV